MALDEETIRELWAIHTGPLATAERRRTATFFDDTRSWVDPNGYRLSDRIWQQRGDVRERIDAIIREAIATGADAITTAKKLEVFLNPRYAVTRAAGGRIIRDGRQGVFTTTPRGGTGSYPARRLMRTEITRAHGQATLETAERFPSVVRWRISGSHPRADPCDMNAERDVGYGKGRYLPKDVPPYPEHPNCLCHLQTIPLESDRELVNRLRQEWGLGQPLDTADFDRLGVRGDNGLRR